MLDSEEIIKNVYKFLNIPYRQSDSEQIDQMEPSDEVHQDSAINQREEAAPEVFEEPIVICCLFEI